MTPADNRVRSMPEPICMHCGEPITDRALTTRGLWVHPTPPCRGTLGRHVRETSAAVDKWPERDKPRYLRVVRSDA